MEGPCPFGGIGGGWSEGNREQEWEGSGNGDDCVEREKIALKNN